MAARLGWTLVLGLVLWGCGDKEEDDTGEAGGTSDGGTGTDGGTSTDGGTAAGPAPIAISTDCDPDRLTDVQFPVDSGTLLRAIGVYEPSPRGGTLTVRVEDTRPTALVLSTYEPVQWIVEEAVSGTVTHVVASSYTSGSTVDAPPGARVDIFDSSTSGALASSNYEWADSARWDLLEAGMSLTGAQVASYTGCSAASSFVLSEGTDWPETPEIAAYDPYPECASSEPVDTILPPDTSLVEDLPACAPITAESAWCLAQTSTAFIAVGLDSGESCEVLAHDASTYGGSREHAWSGTHLYYCGESSILTEVDLETGQVRWADEWCAGIFAWDDALWLAVSDLERFDSFFDARCGVGASDHADLPRDSVYGQDGNQLLTAWHSTDTINVYDLPGAGFSHEIRLEGFDDWVYGLDQVGGSLLVVADTRSAGGYYHLFDATDGSLLRSVHARDASYGLLCFEGG